MVNTGETLELLFCDQAGKNNNSKHTLLPQTKSLHVTMIQIDIYIAAHTTHNAPKNNITERMNAVIQQWAQNVSSGRRDQIDAMAQCALARRGTNPQNVPPLPLMCITLRRPAGKKQLLSDVYPGCYPASHAMHAAMTARCFTLCLRPCRRLLGPCADTRHCPPPSPRKSNGQ